MWSQRVERDRVTEYKCKHSRVIIHSDEMFLFVFVQTSYSSFSGCGHLFYCPTPGCIIGLSGTAVSPSRVVYPCFHPS